MRGIWSVLLLSFLSRTTSNRVIAGDESSSHAAERKRDLITIGTPVPFNTDLAGYNALTLITDHALIDLDQSAIVRALNFNAFSTARDIYEQGAHSASVANMRLEAVLPSFVAEGSLVVGSTASGETIRASVLSNTQPGSITLSILYAVSSDENILKCQVRDDFVSITEGCK
jgi:hypothetical protein